MSPTLLAEPDDEHKHLLRALGRGDERTSGKSIGSAKVFALCKTLFKEFREEEQRVCTALLNRRNDELHTGGAPFSEYQTNVWLAGFYRACNALTTALGETLETLFGQEEAQVASRTLEGDQNDIKQRVASSIAAHRKVYEAKDAAERQELQTKAVEDGEILSNHRHHRVPCPSCKSTGLIQGKAFGKVNVSNGDDEIVIRQSVEPISFACHVCGLKLGGFSELAAAGIAGHYTRTTTYSPQDYYGLVDPDTLDIDELAREWLREQSPDYDNE